MATLTSFSIERITSEKNKAKATIQGFIYTLNRKSHDIEYWVCEKRGICKARLHTNNNQVVKPTDPSTISSDHSHSSDVIRVDMLKGYTNLKRIAANSDSGTRTLLANSVEGMAAECIIKLPKLDSVKRTIRRCKRGDEEYYGNPSSCAEIIIPDRYKFTLNGNSFLLFDSGEGDMYRMMLFGTTKFLSILKESNNWYCDGTFKVVPKHLFQLYTIHAQRDAYIFPCVYALFQAKTEVTYERMLSKLLQLEPELNPTSLMVDFEKAAMNALENKFIACVYGCFFHLSQNIYRRIQADGLATAYQQDADLALKLKMLPCLAFVPEIDVIDCFSILMEEYPQSGMTVAKYFEDNYIGKQLPNGSRRTPLFPIRMWNMHQRVMDQLPRTNNSVEGWHNAFRHGIGHAHPSFVKLLSFLQKEQSLQDAIYAKWEGGTIKKRSKLSVEREKRIYNIVSNYDNRETLEYLRGLAYNMEF